MSDIFDTRFEGKEVQIDDNKVVIGDDMNLMAKDPSLHNIIIGAGWDVNAFDADVLDLDLSLFFVDKHGQTQADEDFVFYNNPVILDGAVKHHGDSRTGAGDGDDETVTIDLHAVSYEVMQIYLVISVYKGFEKEQNLGQVRNAYLRVMNADTNYELVRYNMDKDLEGRPETGVIAATLTREGPKWHFRPMAEMLEGGLAEIATRTGIIIGAQ
ncbi:MAG: TerD family protein [Alphaproteobacteria bacterium]|nr:TerD family protein [Alphaproteobacteria bacterium]